MNRRKRNTVKTPTTWPDPIKFLLPLLTQPGSLFCVFKNTVIVFLSGPATSAMIERYFKNSSFLEAGRTAISWTTHLAMQTRIRAALLHYVNAVVSEAKKIFPPIE